MKAWTVEEGRPLEPASLTGGRAQFLGGLALRVSRYPLQAAFVVVVPPVLGPDAYGAYATCLALFAIVVEATELGTVPLFGRFAPGLAPAAVSLLARQILWTRLVVVLLPGALLLWLLWTPRPEDPLLFLLVLAATAVVPLQQVLFARLYARGQLARFMARDPLRSGLTLLLVVPGYLAGGLVGAVAALTAAQLTLAGVAAAWARPVARDVLPPPTLAGLPGAIRFGVAAALPTVLTIVAIKLGTPLLSRLGMPAREVAAFDLATHGLALVLALTAYPFAALLPRLGVRVDRAGGALAGAVVARVTGRVTAAGLLLVAALVLAGRPLLGLVLGPGFAGVYPNLLLVVGWGLVPLVLAQAGLALAVLGKRPGQVIAPAAALAGVAAGGTLALGGPLGAAGAATALVAAFAAQALLLLATTPGLGRVARAALPGMLAALPALALGTADAWGAVAPSLGGKALAVAPCLAAAAWTLVGSRGEA